MTKWQPNVCTCKLLIDENSVITFEDKNGVHAGMTDEDAIADIIALCAAVQVIGEPIEDII